MSQNSRRVAFVAGGLVTLVALAVFLVLRITNPSSSRAPGQTAAPTAGMTAAQASPTPSAVRTTPAPPPSVSPSVAPSPASSAPPAASLTTVGVLTTFAGWNSSTSSVDVGGYADAVESDGMCTLTLSRASANVVRSQAATVDASTTSCGGFTVAAKDLSSGTWDARLTYSSPRSTGSAAPVSIEVP